MGFWMNFALLLLSLITVELWLYTNRLVRRQRRNLPPGPFPFPIIGNLLNLGKIPHRSLAELAKIHGPLMSLNMGSLTTIVASSPYMAQQVLQKQDQLFSNRSVADANRALHHHQFSVVFMPPNPIWRTIRRICNSHAFSHKSLDATQHLRQKKVEELISYIRGRSEAGVAVNIGQEVFFSNLSLTSNTFFSMDLAEIDSSFNHDFKQLMWKITYEAGNPNLSDYFPLIKGLDLQRIRHRMKEYRGKMINLFQSIIDQRLANKRIDSSTEFNDVLEAFLKMRESDVDKLDMSYITHTIMDLFAGGTETSSSTIEWAMTELLRDRSKLKKAQAELKLIVGKGNLVKEEDITRLPYLRAIVKETLRLHPPLPLLVPREIISDVEFCGFKLPKGSQVLVNIWAIGRDPSVWERASYFEPERFLESEIDVKGLHFELTPFGGGRRICPGLTLSIRILHTILGSLINSFDWKLKDGVEPKNIDMDEKLGLAVQKAKPLLAIPLTI